MIKNIKCNIKKSIMIIFLGGILVAVCAFFGFVDFRRFINNSPFDNDIIYYLIKGVTIFSFIFFAFGLIIIIRNLLFYRDKMIEFTDEYLIDRSSYIAGGKIYYTEIRRVYIEGSFLCIQLKNEIKFLNQNNKLKQIFMLLNKKMNFEYITISANFLDTSIYEIEQILQDKLKE